ncbi:MAG: DUF2264 domain-containing protein, partial [Firmicutes bacterium]|nr:DUF2264 domain-containing protein [Bacillota bacterium]
MPNPVSQNLLRTRADVEKAALQLLEPLVPLLSDGKARLRLGDTGAVYPASTADMEAFARPLWAIVPMLAGRCAGIRPIWEHWRQGIIHGTAPDHPEYWGVCGDYDQRLVEMAVFGVGMAMAPEEFFYSLPKAAQENLYQWLNQINRLDMPKNNWVFFRVLVNLGFRRCGLPWAKEQVAKDFALIDSHYEGDGWYYDYPGQRDYYVPWAFHYYGLLYAAVAPEDEHSAWFTERAKLFAPDFACWFDDNGEALPFGRSLTYRFAQGSFFAAQAFAQAAAAPIGYGEMKRLLLGNMRAWFQKPIFTRDGVLTIGYAYPNLLMAEGYNAPGSPYWSMKAFLCLALPQEHPFWQADEAQPRRPASARQISARMLVTRPEAGHVIAYQAGSHCTEHAHSEAKYEKFAYSTVFGFSVPKAQKRLQCGAFDSMLAVSLNGVDYVPRYGCETFDIAEDRVFCTWSPMPGVRIETELIPCGVWHLRKHTIQNEMPILAAEGAFAVSIAEDAYT